MAYKQSPFPMIEGTSPVKYKKWLAQKLIKYGAKGVKAIKKAFSKKPKWQGREMTKSTVTRQVTSKSAHVKGTYHHERLHKYLPNRAKNLRNPNQPQTMWPGQMSTQHPNFMKYASEQSKTNAKYWFNYPLKK